MATIERVGFASQDGRDGGRFYIWGTGFVGVSEVYLVDSTSKKVLAKSFTVLSDTQIKGTHPSLKAGLVRMNVTVGKVDATRLKTADLDQFDDPHVLPMHFQQTDYEIQFDHEYSNEFLIVDTTWAPKSDVVP